MVDGSQKSISGLDVIARILKPGDRVTAIYMFEHDEHLEAVRQKFENKRKALGLDVKLLLNKVAIGETVSTKLLEFVNENDKLSFDWLVIGSNGLSKETNENDSLGSTASLIMQKCLVNLVIV